MVSSDLPPIFLSQTADNTPPPTSLPLSAVFHLLRESLPGTRPRSAQPCLHGADMLQTDWLTDTSRYWNIDCNSLHFMHLMRPIIVGVRQRDEKRTIIDIQKSLKCDQDINFRKQQICMCYEHRQEQIPEAITSGSCAW